MSDEIKCFTCQDFRINVGHDTKSCPKNICQKCGQNGHTKMECMADFKNFPLPNEIMFKIFRYLSQEDMDQCSKVCKRFLNVKVHLDQKKKHRKWNNQPRVCIIGCL